MRCAAAAWPAKAEMCILTRQHGGAVLRRYIEFGSVGLLHTEQAGSRTCEEVKVVESARLLRVRRRLFRIRISPGPSLHVFFSLTLFVCHIIVLLILVVF